MLFLSLSFFFNFFFSFSFRWVGGGWLGVCFRYTTSPHLFSGEAEVAFARVRSKVCSLVGTVWICIVLATSFCCYMDPFEAKLGLIRFLSA